MYKQYTLGFNSDPKACLQYYIQPCHQKDSSLLIGFWLGEWVQVDRLQPHLRSVGTWLTWKKLSQDTSCSPSVEKSRKHTPGERTHQGSAHTGGCLASLWLLWFSWGLAKRKVGKFVWPSRLKAGCLLQSLPKMTLSKLLCRICQQSSEMDAVPVV